MLTMVEQSGGEISPHVDNKYLLRKIEAPSQLLAQYEAVRPQVEQLYRHDVALWHGTGRWQYGKDGEPEFKDILEQIIADGGLKPHPDPFDAVTGTVTTVSLTDRREYAAGYGKIHLWEKEQLQYENLPQTFWGKFFIRDTIRSGAKEALIAKHRQWKFENAKNWYGRVRKQPKSAIVSAIITTPGLLRSDIVGNYPILIGIKDDVIEPVATAKYIARHEVRADKLVPLKGISHIEVPLANVEETTQKLAEKNVNLVVLPMEFGEMFASQYPLPALIAGNPFRNSPSTAVK